MSDDPTYLAQLEPVFEGLRKARVPEQWSNAARRFVAILAAGVGVREHRDGTSENRANG